MSDCTCRIEPPQRESAYGRSLSRYVIYLDTWEDGTEFDPACPFHGERGTMVTALRLLGTGEQK